MDPVVASSVIGAGSDFLGSLFGLGGTAVGYKEQRKLMDLQYQRQIDFWKMNNEYNSPVNQMKRFEEAGVNPYMALGNSNTSTYGSVMQSVPTPAPYGQQLQSGISSAGSLIADMYLKAAQARNLQAQTDLTEEKTLTQQGLTRMQDVLYREHEGDVKLKQQLYDFREVMNSAEYQLCVAQYNNTVQRTINASREYEVLGMKIKVSQREYENLLYVRDEILSRTHLNQAQADYAIARACAARIDNVINGARAKYADINARNESSLLQNNAAASFENASYLHDTAGNRRSIMSFEELLKASQGKSASEQARLFLKYGEGAIIKQTFVPFLPSPYSLTK